MKSGLTIVFNELYDICIIDSVKCPLSLDKEEVAITFKIVDVDAVYIYLFQTIPSCLLFCALV